MLKYKDLPRETKDLIEYAYGHIPRSKNPSVILIIEKLNKRMLMYAEEGAYKSAEEIKEAITYLRSKI